jgi:hypothetical protein
MAAEPVPAREPARAAGAAPAAATNEQPFLVEADAAANAIESVETQAAGADAAAAMEILETPDAPEGGETSETLEASGARVLRFWDATADETALQDIAQTHGAVLEKVQATDAAVIWRVRLTAASEEAFLADVARLLTPTTQAAGGAPPQAPAAEGAAESAAADGADTFYLYIER